MSTDTVLATATGGHLQVPETWMSASGVEPLVLGDPVLVWLKYHGEEQGFHRDASPYDFIDFIGEKGRQFEDKWIEELVPDAVRVCARAHEVRDRAKVRETLELMRAGTPALVQPALWWAPERIYGVPDVLVHTSWLRVHIPHLINGSDPSATAPGLSGNGRRDHYIVFDMKFTSELDSPHKTPDLSSYAGQVRLYAYMLGHLQGIMPQHSYLVTRDRILNPLPIEITSELGRPLDSDLAALRDQYVTIKVDGAQYVPWRDAIVASDLSHRDERWFTAKRTIARECMPGRDPAIVYQIGPTVKRALEGFGFSTLDSLLQVDPGEIPLEQCDNLGPANAERIRAILEANRTGSAVVPPSTPTPAKKEYEFFVDFEYFSNVNVDFERQWPGLEGCEMIFVIGLGWEEEGEWAYRSFAASAENHVRERVMLESFVEFLDRQTEGAFLDGRRSTIYHWTGAEVWQSLRAAERHELPDGHPLRSLPWSDLQKCFLEGPIGLPGAWTYRLKDVTKALANLWLEFNLEWPGDLDQGLRAMVMGWRAYQSQRPLETKEMGIVTDYLEADCRALWAILKWMRSRTGRAA